MTLSRFTSSSLSDTSSFTSTILFLSCWLGRYGDWSVLADFSVRPGLGLRKMDSHSRAIDDWHLREEILHGRHYRRSFIRDRSDCSHSHHHRIVHSLTLTHSLTRVEGVKNDCEKRKKRKGTEDEKRVGIRGHNRNGSFTHPSNLLSLFQRQSENLVRSNSRCTHSERDQSANSIARMSHQQ